MRIFISWSGERSRQAAAAFRAWLPLVLQYVRPWMSEEDIGKGARGTVEIQAALTGADFGIICVTHENVAAPWLNYEAGALSQKVRVATFLIDTGQRDLQGPLTDFQRTWFDRDDVRRLVATINGQAEGALAEPVLARSFDKWWPDLEQALSSILKETGDAQPVKRSEGDMLEEILEIVRSGRSSDMRYIVRNLVNQTSPPPSQDSEGSAAKARVRTLYKQLQGNALTYSIPLGAFSVEPRLGHLVVHIDDDLSQPEIDSLLSGIDVASPGLHILNDFRKTP